MARKKWKIYVKYGDRIVFGDIEVQFKKDSNRRAFLEELRCPRKVRPKLKRRK